MSPKIDKIQNSQNTTFSNSHLTKKYISINNIKVYDWCKVNEDCLRGRAMLCMAVYFHYHFTKKKAFHLKHSIFITKTDGFDQLNLL